MGLIVGSLIILDGTGDQGCTTPAISRDALNTAIGGQAEDFVEAVPGDERPEIDSANQVAIRAVIDQVVACSNAGEPLRVWSLYSADYLARLFRIQGPFDEAMYAAYAKPLPSADGSGMHVRDLGDMWQRADGLYGADVTMTYSAVPMPKELIFWFRSDDGKWTIEEITGEISFSLP